VSTETRFLKARFAIRTAFINRAACAALGKVV